VYTQFALGDTLGSTTWSLVPTLVALVWIIAAGLFIGSRLMPADRFATDRTCCVFRLGRARVAATAAALCVVGLVVGVPIANLAVKAGRVVTRGADGFVRSWSLDQCAAMVLGSPLRFGREFGWTLLVGLLRRGGWRAVPAWVLIALGLAVPGPLIGLALIAAFNRPGAGWLSWLYDQSIAPIWIAQTIRVLPLATLVLWYALRTIPPEVLTSATMDGASPLVRLLRIALPQRLPAVAAAWLVALALAAGELDASILVVPPGVATLPIQIFGLIHYGVDDRVAGISLFVMAAFFAIVAGPVWLARRGIDPPPGADAARPKAR
jgi:iron(III) transport system permease protein